MLYLQWISRQYKFTFFLIHIQFQLVGKIQYEDAAVIQQQGIRKLKIMVLEWQNPLAPRSALLIAWEH